MEIRGDLNTHPCTIKYIFVYIFFNMTHANPPGNSQSPVNHNKTNRNIVSGFEQVHKRSVVIPVNEIQIPLTYNNRVPIEIQYTYCLNSKDGDHLNLRICGLLKRYIFIYIFNNIF